MSKLYLRIPIAVVIIVLCIIALFPLDSDIHFKKGYRSMEAGRLKEAVEHFERAVKYWKYNGMAWYSLGMTLDMLYPNKSKVHLPPILSEFLLFFEPITPLEAIGLSRDIILARRVEPIVDEIIRSLRNAELDYKNQNLYQRLGYMYFLKDNLDRAQQCYLRAMEYDPDNSNALLGLSYLYARLGDKAYIQGDVEKAKRYYLISLGEPGHQKNQSVITRLPDEILHKIRQAQPCIRSLSHLAALCYMQGELEKAGRYIQRTLEQDKMNPLGLFLAASINAKNTRFGKALFYARTLIESKQPFKAEILPFVDRLLDSMMPDPEAVELKARWLFEMGDYPRMKELLERHEEYIPLSSQLALMHEIVDAQLGGERDALDKLLTRHPREALLLQWASEFYRADRASSTRQKLKSEHPLFAEYLSSMPSGQAFYLDDSSLFKCIATRIFYDYQDDGIFEEDLYPAAVFTRMYPSENINCRVYLQQLVGNAQALKIGLYIGERMISEGEVSFVDSPGELQYLDLRAEIPPFISGELMLKIHYALIDQEENAPNSCDKECSIDLYQVNIQPAGESLAIRTRHLMQAGQHRLAVVTLARALASVLRVDSLSGSDSRRLLGSVMTAISSAEPQRNLTPFEALYYGMGLEVMGKAREAMEIYSSAIDDSKDDINLLYRYMLVLQRSGRYKHADKIKDRISRLDPGFVPFNLYSTLDYRKKRELLSTKFEAKNWQGRAGNNIYWRDGYASMPIYLYPGKIRLTIQAMSNDDMVGPRALFYLEDYLLGQENIIGREWNQLTYEVKVNVAGNYTLTAWYQRDYWGSTTPNSKDLDLYLGAVSVEYLTGN